MATIEYVGSEIIGTGDRDASNKAFKSDASLSTVVAREIVSEILENAMELVSEKANKGDIIERKSSRSSCTKLKLEARDEFIITPSSVPLKGVGDQVTNHEIVTPESKYKHPLVEKKNRLTDLVKNSKQILAKYIQSKTDVSTSEHNVIHNERIIKIINPCDMTVNHEQVLRPENIPLPRDDSNEILGILEGDEEEKMDEVRLENTETGAKAKNEYAKKTMTFPIGSSKSSFAAKCRTLKMNASDFKKKKWNWSTKLANLIRYKKNSKKEKINESSKRALDQSDKPSTSAIVDNEN